jgi:PAS domain S-box-containing protein
VEVCHSLSGSRGTADHDVKRESFRCKLSGVDSVQRTPPEAAFVAEDRWSCRSRVAALERVLSPLDPRRWIGSGGRPADLEARVEAAENALAGVFGDGRAMLFIADLVEGSFLWVNHGAGEVLGYATRQLLESSFLERVHPEDLPRTMAVMERLVAGENVCCFRNRHRHADGSFRVLEWTAIAEADGETCYAMAIEVGEL